MKPTKQQKLSSLDEEIKERKEYLATIERDIEAVTTAGNNALFNMRGDMENLEREKAALLKKNYQLDQVIREKKRLAEL